MVNIDTSMSVLRKIGYDKSSVYALGKSSDLDFVLSNPPLMVIAKSISNSEFDLSRNLKIQVKKNTPLVMPFSYYMDNRKNGSGKKVLKMTDRQLKHYYDRLSLDRDLNDKHIFIWRNSGIGDLLFIQPILKYIKANFKNTYISFSTGFQLIDFVNCWPEGLIDELVAYPFTLKSLLSSDYHFTFEGILERTNSRENAYDLYFKALGIDDKNTVYDYYPEVIDLELNNKLINSLPSDYVLVQMNSTSPIRNMGEENWIEVIKYINNLGFKVVFFDERSNSKYYDKLIGDNFESHLVYNMSEYSNGINDVVTVASKSRGVIGIDSSFIHLCGIMKKPGVGIFGSFLGSSRVDKYPTIDWVDADKVCEYQPCHFHNIDKCPYVKSNKRVICLNKGINIDKLNEVIKRKFI